MSLAEISSEQNSIEYFIDFLCSLSFIGREVRAGEFEYQYDLDLNFKTKILANKLNSNRFKIHNAFIPFLKCSDCNL